MKLLENDDLTLTTVHGQIREDLEKRLSRIFEELERHNADEITAARDFRPAYRIGRRYEEEADRIASSRTPSPNKVAAAALLRDIPR